MILEGMHLGDVCTELQDYTTLVSDEWQEGVDKLISLTRHSYVFSDEFNQALAAELKEQLLNCRENAVITEHSVTETVVRTYKTLDWDL